MRLTITWWIHPGRYGIWNARLDMLTYRIHNLAWCLDVPMTPPCIGIRIITWQLYHPGVPTKYGPLYRCEVTYKTILSHLDKPGHMLGSRRPPLHPNCQHLAESMHRCKYLHLSSAAMFLILSSPSHYIWVYPHKPFLCPALGVSCYKCRTIRDSASLMFLSSCWFKSWNSYSKDFPPIGAHREMQWQ